jgi:hypothetical protein
MDMMDCLNFHSAIRLVAQFAQGQETNAGLIAFASTNWELETLWFEELVTEGSEAGHTMVLLLRAASTPTCMVHGSALQFVSATT